MKKIDTSPIAPGIGYPFSKNKLNFLQQAYQEPFAHLAQSRIGNTPSSTLGYILYGCVKTLISGSNYSFTAGAIYFNGEIYPVAAISTITLTAAFILKITDVADPVADPTIFTDLSPHNVHRVRTLVISSATLNSGDLNYDDLVFLINKSTAYALTAKAYNPSAEVVGGFTFSTYNYCNYIKNGNSNVHITIKGMAFNIASGVRRLEIDLPAFLIGVSNKFGNSSATLQIASTTNGYPLVAEIVGDVIAVSMVSNNTDFPVITSNTGQLYLGINIQLG